MSKNYLFTKKGKKQFNKLTPEEKELIAKMAIDEAVDKALRKHIPLAVIRGGRLKVNALYEKHVQEIDKMATGDKEWVLAVNQLLSDIRMGHLEYEKLSGKKEEQDGE